MLIYFHFKRKKSITLGCISPLPFYLYSHNLIIIILLNLRRKTSMFSCSFLCHIQFSEKTGRYAKGLGFASGQRHPVVTWFKRRKYFPFNGDENVKLNYKSHTKSFIRLSDFLFVREILFFIPNGIIW